jgi:poly(3-hydroxybutyrate) depolymerase
MMRVRPELLGLSLLLASCGGETEVVNVVAPTFDIDPTRITVSGVSAGAYMAGQLHVAHSRVFGGAGLIAGGPYWCASGSMKKSLGPCMNGGDIGLEELRAYVTEQVASSTIDPLDNLVDDRAWVFHGTLDTVVSKDVPTAATSFYGSFLAPENITFVADIEAPHGVPTLDVGAACDSMVTPFLNACNYDAAGALLEALLGPLSPRVTAIGELLTVAQPGADDADMLASALLYVPASCANGKMCGVHVALHDCQQSIEFIGDVFAAGAGYNEWAEANDLLVLYPQVASSKIAPSNPLGCWDWWGYTGESYATKSGPQIAVIKAMLDSLAGRTL